MNFCVLCPISLLRTLVLIGTPADALPLLCPPRSRWWTAASDEGDFIRRRRQCAHCGKRFTTYERPDVSYPSIIKKDGRRVPYARAKLQGSLQLALRKRPVSTEQQDAAIERIEEKLLATGAREVSSSRIGELVMREPCIGGNSARSSVHSASPACTARAMP